jgi:hypothetical protein
MLTIALQITKETIKEMMLNVLQMVFVVLVVKTEDATKTGFKVDVKIYFKVFTLKTEVVVMEMVDSVVRVVILRLKHASTLFLLYVVSEVCNIKEIYQSVPTLENVELVVMEIKTIANHLLKAVVPKTIKEMVLYVLLTESVEHVAKMEDATKTMYKVDVN